jgi:streptomycin 6-kinase
MDAIFDPWMKAWSLTPDGDGFASLAGHLLPVRHEGAAAMLKVTQEKEEIAGGALMAWWAGEGAARVLAWDGEALLLERALGPNLLADMARTGRDDEACRILCAAGAQLHAPRPRPTPESLVPLERWFRQLWPTAQAQGGVFATSAAVARALLDDPQEVGVLHGDLHHGNVLDFGERGWLAIDPKGLLGDRGYDHANMLCNPDAATALAPGRMARQVEVVAEAAGMERRRVLGWLLAYCGLSGSWTLADGPGDVARTLALAEMAAGLLEG